MRKIKFNRHTLLSLAVTCAAFTSCTSSEEISPSVEPTIGDSELAGIVKDKEFDDIVSRSSLSLDGNKMVFAWDSGDAMTVFADGDISASQVYNLSAGAGEPMASFRTDNFSMTQDKLYYAFSKKHGGNVNITNQNNITVNYDGQRQIGNANYTHLGNYDFMAAGVLCEDPTNVLFRFSHFGATFRLVISFNPSLLPDGDEKEALQLSEKDDVNGLTPIYFTEMEIFDKKNTFCQTSRNFSFSVGKTKVNDNGVEKDAYKFRWPANPNTGDMNRFKLRLGSGDGPTEGGLTRFTQYNETTAPNTNGKLITYIEVPPHMFQRDNVNPANTNYLNILLRGYYEKRVNETWVKVPVSYVYEYKDNFVFEAEKAHQLNFTAQKPEEFKVTLKVNHTWQHGDVVDDTTVSPAKSRATGDPGNDKEIHLPKYIYYIYCHDGKVVKPSYEIGADAVTKITATESSDWSTERREPDHNDISTYIGNDGALDGVVTLTKYLSDEPGHDDHAGDCTYHLYVVASESELSLPVTVGDSEESIRTLTYSIGGSNAQVFMRDLYSTPWDATNFEGNLTTKKKDITLYHVAAMVDVKWNTVNTAITNVSVNNVKTENLFLFKPTENTGGILTAPNGYTETKTISDEDDKYLGREVFYLPQFKSDCSYNIGLNSAKETVTFTPDVSKGYTSWLRWLKKKN